MRSSFSIALLFIVLLPPHAISLAEAPMVEYKVYNKIYDEIPKVAADFLRKYPGEGLKKCKYQGKSTTEYAKLSKISEHPIGLCRFDETNYGDAGSGPPERQVGNIIDGEFVVSPNSVMRTSHYVALRSNKAECPERDDNFYTITFDVDDEQSYSALYFLHRLTLDAHGFEKAFNSIDTRFWQSVGSEILGSRLNLKVVSLSASFRSLGYTA